MTHPSNISPEFLAHLAAKGQSPDQFATSEDLADAEHRFWQSRSPHERMEALESLRQRTYGYDETAPRMSRDPKTLKLRRRKMR